MIIIDTNVISEPSRQKPDQRVIEWLDQQVRSTLFLTSVSVAELYRGIALLPEGRRKFNLKSETDQLLEPLFSTRVLPFDLAAAHIYAQVSSKAKRGGFDISLADGQIASVALTHGFAVATRDVAPFEAAGVKVINPWEG